MLVTKSADCAVTSSNLVTSIRTVIRKQNIIIVYSVYHLKPFQYLQNKLNIFEIFEKFFCRRVKNYSLTTWKKTPRNIVEN